MSIVELDANQNIFPIGIVVSRFNEMITQKLYQGALARLGELGFKPDQITSAWVPGAVEIPIVAQRLALQKRFPVLIALGAVIQGETSHFDYVCNQVNDGCLQVSLLTNTPVIFGVLTTHSVQQALDRVGGSRGHAGRDAVDTAVEMVKLLRTIDKEGMNSHARGSA